MSNFQSTLLRRTAVAFTAAAGFFVYTAPQAASVTLTGASGNSCTYSSMSVQPDGSFNVSCLVSGGTGPGSVSLSNPGTVTGGTNATLSVFRSGGAQGAASVAYNVAGTGCASAGGQFQWADGDATTQTITVTTLAAGGACTVNIGGPTGVSLGSPAVVQFTVNAAGGGTPPPPVDTANCPTGFTPPQDMLSMQLGGLGNPLLAMARSNQVVSIPLPNVQPGYSTGQVAFGESAGGAYTPQPVTLNISISKCKGLISNDYSNRCNLTSTNGNYNSLTWFSQAYSIIKDAASANLRGYCWAPSSEGQWYINTSWSYAQCAFGAQTCGFAIQQNYGPY